MRSDCFPAFGEREMVTLREERGRVACRDALYRFCRGDLALPQYYAEILYAGERATACLGTDRERAERIFELLVWGKVTPCTLCDIAEDMKADGKI